MAFEEYDVVRSKQSITDKVLMGTRGTIVIVHNSVPVAYEVEFVNAEGETIDIVTVEDGMIELVIS